jgi:hypothetical protein
MPRNQPKLTTKRSRHRTVREFAAKMPENADSANAATGDWYGGRKGEKCQPINARNKPDRTRKNL